MHAHHTVVNVGSSTVFCNGLAVARVGDSGAGEMTSGSSNVNLGNRINSRMTIVQSGYGAANVQILVVEVLEYIKIWHYHLKRTIILKM